MLITVKMPEWVLSEKNVCNCTFVVAGMVALGYSYQAIVVWRISVARRCVYAHGYVEPSQGWLCCFDSCFVHANVRFSAGHSVATAAQRSGCRSGHPVAIAAQRSGCCSGHPVAIAAQRNGCRSRHAVATAAERNGCRSGHPVAIAAQRNGCCSRHAVATAARLAA